MVAPATRSTVGREGRKGKDKVPKLKHGETRVRLEDVQRLLDGVRIH